MNRKPYNRLASRRDMERHLRTGDGIENHDTDVGGPTPQTNEVDWEIVDKEVRKLPFELLQRLWMGNTPFDNPYLKRFEDLKFRPEFQEIVNTAHYNAKVGEGLAI